MISAFGVEHPAVAKALTGQRGDKRNTAYAGAGLGGALGGRVVGRRAGMRAAGTSSREFKRAGLVHAQLGALTDEPSASVVRGMLKIRGAKAGLAGGLLGGAAGSAGSAIAVKRRRSRESPLAKSAFGVEHP